MRAIVPINSSLPRPLAELGASTRLEESLAPLQDLAGNSLSITASAIGEIATKEGKLPFPRFVFLGPKGGGDTIRVGIFAALHGNDFEGPGIVAGFFRALEMTPGLANGFHLYAYPICNPAGFAQGSRHNHHGEDLPRHLWRGSRQVEAYYLEREIGVHQFHGVISLHGGADGEISYHLNGRPNSVLHDALAKPALDAAFSMARFTVKPFERGGFLTNTTELWPAPFEMNWRIPRSLPNVAVAVLFSILDSYRTLLALRQNI